MEVRELRTHEEYRAAEALQRLIWGDDFDLVPSHLVKIAQRLGGVGAGAFADDGEMLGFVFGMTGVESGELVHWSDILAVRPDARGRGVGRMLKEHQRATVRSVGVSSMWWSFDPLVARNAHLNLTRLGARVVEYIPDMYEESGSGLNRGLGMDRLVVCWDVTEQRPTARAIESNAATYPIINLSPDGSPSQPNMLEGAPAHIAIQVPADIHAVRDRSPSLARRWRESSRAAFVEALSGGYRVTGFRDGRYLLSREQGS
jgi:predicted GNAT superfamily acetyltransferase